MNNIKATQSRNEMEIASGLVGDKSWHAQYKDSAYVYVGGFPFDLTEGDLIAVMSQCVPRSVLVPSCPCARPLGIVRVV
jgi:RNA-binding motif X-linked protein 2